MTLLTWLDGIVPMAVASSTRLLVSNTNQCILQPQAHLSFILYYMSCFHLQEYLHSVCMASSIYLISQSEACEYRMILLLEAAKRWGKMRLPFPALLASCPCSSKTKMASCNSPSPSCITIILGAHRIINDCRREKPMYHSLSCM